MWGIENGSTKNDHINSPLEEQIFGKTPLVPLYTISL
jgi:hypothetical protein